MPLEKGLSIVICVLTTSGALILTGLIAIATKPSTPCVHDNLWEHWHSWSECSQTCGGIGTRSRNRHCRLEGHCQTLSQPFEDTLSCGSTAPCDELTDKENIWLRWHSWGPCSESCGEEGVRNRMRYCLNELCDDLKGNVTEVHPEPCVGKQAFVLFVYILRNKDPFYLSQIPPLMTILRTNGRNGSPGASIT